MVAKKDETKKEPEGKKAPTVSKKPVKDLEIKPGKGGAVKGGGGKETTWNKTCYC